MGLTRVKSKTVSTFIQPNLEGTVTIVSDTGIDWLRVGQTIQIPDGGIYEIMSNSGFTWNIKLKTAIALPGQTVSANVLYPVSDTSAATKWGGPNGKEW